MKISNESLIKIIKDKNTNKFAKAQAQNILDTRVGPLANREELIEKMKKIIEKDNISLTDEVKIDGNTVSCGGHFVCVLADNEIPVLKKIISGH